jgi:hypothetical protein
VHECFGSRVAQARRPWRATARAHRWSAPWIGTGHQPGHHRGPDGQRRDLRLSAALWGQITLDKGRPQQTNFHDYRIVRMRETPRIETHIVNAGDAHGGIGEPGTAPTAPAVCNAIFALTGKPVRNADTAGG